MNVEELIEFLKKCDPKKEVLVEDAGGLISPLKDVADDNLGDLDNIVIIIADDKYI